LYSNVWHQGTVYEASAYIVPFLLHMLTDDGPPAKSDLLHFLSALAEGNSHLAVHVRPDDDQAKWQQTLAEQGRDFETDLQKELAEVDAVNYAVGEGVPIYLDLLEHEDAEVRRLSLYTLARLRGQTAEIVAHLQNLLPTVQDAEMRAAIVCALHDLMGDGTEARQFFADLVQRHENEKITFLAAVALVKRAREQTPESVVMILLNALQELGQIRHSQPDFKGNRGNREIIEAKYRPAWGQDSLQFAVDALTSLGQARAIETLLNVLPLVQDAEDALELAGSMLDLVFKAGQIQAKETATSWHGEGVEKVKRIDYWEPKPQPLRQASTLTDVQRTVLAALVAHDPVWEFEHNLPSLYGLLTSREELRQFIA
jgi:hypothetical protein